MIGMMEVITGRVNRTEGGNGGMDRGSDGSLNARWYLRIQYGRSIDWKPLRSRWDFVNGHKADISSANSV